MTKHHPTGLNHYRPGTWPANFVKTCRAVGMTDAEIATALRLKHQPVAPARVLLEAETNAEGRQMDCDERDEE